MEQRSGRRRRSSSSGDSSRSWSGGSSSGSSGNSSSGGSSGGSSGDNSGKTWPDGEPATVPADLGQVAGRPTAVSVPHPVATENGVAVRSVCVHKKGPGD